MKARPLELTILSLYLLIVFGLSAIGSLFGAARELAPYTSSEWLILMVPKLLAIAAGLAFWRMLRIGAWLWLSAAILGWALVFILRTGFLPNFTIASAVALVILGLSLWAVARNWRDLKPLGAARGDQSEAIQ